ncbi:allantoicase [Aquitalea pelogenes]|uniref:allantoicase n=1 Tax=Aquitalea pelogenes TaxID=1293573 RepID=UPI000787D78E|nr:allantoicase [Aquitalea pelogenes]
MNHPVLTAPAALLPDWASQAINLADPRIGARGLYASDEFFAPLARMLNPEAAIFVPGKYDENGKWMDGWETRRKRHHGHDWSIIRLGRPGRIAGFDIDTSHFTGNYAPAISIEATHCADDSLQALEQAIWQEILPSMALGGDQHHLLQISNDGVWSHLRLRIYPDGGIARLRVYGQPDTASALQAVAEPIDLVAMENGGRPIAWNDAHFGHPSNLLLPGRGSNMGEGWETRRRREPGHDWCILALGVPGVIERIVVDTAHFKGNFADRCSLQAAKALSSMPAALIAESQFWPVLLPETPLTMDAIHHFANTVAQLGPVSHVRLNIHPDGGISRLRLFGQVAR